MINFALLDVTKSLKLNKLNNGKINRNDKTQSFISNELIAFDKYTFLKLFW